MTDIFDFSHVHAGLKDFQRDTVEYVFKRMYKDRARASRFLVADEVGLGKTLIARGVVAHAIQALHEEDPNRRIDILYICSNADIAAQNINKLNVAGPDYLVRADRLTLLANSLGEVQDRRLNFVSFTPGTSFNVSGGLGRHEERVLLYWLLRKAWGKQTVSGAGSVRLLAGAVNLKRFGQSLRDFERGNVAPAIAKSFVERLRVLDAERKAKGEPSTRRQFGRLRKEFQRKRKSYPDDVVSDRRALIGSLRHLLARVCLDALEPDLVILDEFQRFRSLLQDDDKDEAALLAQELFNYGDVRILLLSATPYKMYTLRGEADGDDHYEDFVKTLKFLDQEVAKRVEDGLRDLRALLLRGADAGEVAHRRDVIAKELRRVMVRTERLAMTESRDGMLSDRKAAGVRLEARDLKDFRSLHRIAVELDAPDALELWKSAPYLLQFMDDYKLKRALEAASRRASPEVAAIVRDARGTLDWSDVQGYQEIDPGNAKLRSVLADTVGAGAWKALWMPPALPYHEPGPPFDEPGLENFTKRLIFSAWRVVPKVVATLVSYEAERQIMRDQRGYDQRSRMAQLLEFRREGSTGRLTGMPVFALLYPSPVLARAADPRELGGGSVADLRRAALERIRPLVSEIVPEDATDGVVDERWYWAAPILLDQGADGDWNRRWWQHANLPSVWGDDTDGDERVSRYWPHHVHAAREVLTGGTDLGRPPDDLAEVVADLALGGPAVVALRALSRIAGGQAVHESPRIRDDAAAVAWSFRNLFNLPESMAIVRDSSSSPDHPYWRQVAEYSVNGNLQAVLDEYVHVLPEWLGRADAHPDDASHDVADGIRRAMSLRTATYRIDDVRAEGDRVLVDRNAHGLRGHFALQFGTVESEDAKQVARTSQVREAFNSPFWPFVLASTSVGQEGLDFHLYCHAVVHWNLPSNPVDLEQREGRVHRYKGHAVRKNVAAQCREAALNGDGDSWAAMFEAAAAMREPGDNELVPYWVFRGETTIDRYVPTLPLSRDVERLEDLRRTLGAYRLAFGQPRQADLVAFLRRQMADGELPIEELRIDLSPPPNARRAPNRSEPKRKVLRAKRRGDLSSATTGQWDEESLLEQLAERCGEDAVANARLILDWAKDHHLLFWWGSGLREAACWPFVPGVDGSEGYMFSLEASGRVGVQFRWLLKKKTYSSVEARVALLEQLNAIDGVELQRRGIGSSTGVSLNRLTPEAVSRILSVFDEVVTELRSEAWEA